jgi:hypothetical protein
MEILTIAEVKARNKASGQYFFSRDTMRFFNSRVMGGLQRGRYFITSERYDDYRPARYTVRTFDNLETCHVRTLGEFQGFGTIEDAKDFISLCAATAI